MNANTSTAFCLNCGCKMEYKKVCKRVEIEVRGLKFECVEAMAICTDCGTELYVPEINDENAQAREDSYRRAAGLITVDGIQAIMKKYNIGAGPLAQALGFGEITINRYLTGQIPSKGNSEILLEVLASYRKMDSHLEENKDSVSPVAYRKCREKLDEFIDLYGDRKIEVITRCMLHKVSDITPLALQKILYYAQAFYYTIFGVELFNDACQAWAHGPVYPDIYYKYRAFGYNPIDDPMLEVDEDLNELTNREVDFIDSVISVFGCYSGTALATLTHNEKPWIDARGNLLPGDRSVTEIPKEAIHSYFKQMADCYHIINPCDMKNYSEAMAERLL